MALEQNSFDADQIDGSQPSPEPSARQQRQQQRQQRRQDQRQQQQRQQQRQRQPQPSPLDEPRQAEMFGARQMHGQTHSPDLPGRGGRVRDAIVAFNCVLVAGFIACATTTGYYSLRSRRFSHDPPAQHLLQAGFSASLAALLSALLCIGFVWRPNGRMPSVDQPLFVPLIIMCFAAVPAIVCGVKFKSIRGVSRQDNEDQLRELLGFTASLSVVGVTLPWFCTAAVSHTQ